MAQKAIMTNSISRDKTGYFYSSEFIGGEKADVVRFLFAHPDIYNYLVTTIGQNNLVDDIEIDKAKTADKVETIKTKVDDLAELNKLREKAGELGIKGYFNAKAETLRIKIAAKEKELAEA